MKASTIASVGLRTVEACLRRRLRLSPRPYKVLLELTYDCNSRCRRCGIWKTPREEKAEEIGLVEIERFFLHSGKDIVWLALSGGEITLVDDFPAVVDLAKRLCPSLRLLTFTTNGLRPERALAWAQVLQRTGCDSFVTVSLDGDEATHDAIRGVPGSHRSAKRTHALLREHGVPVQFGITVSEDNETFIAAHYRQMRDELRAITFVHGGGIYRQTNQVDDESIARSLRAIGADYSLDGAGHLLEWMFVRLGVSFVENSRSENVVPCGVGHTSVHVKPSGTVHPCMFLPAIGTIRSEDTVSEMLDSPMSREMLRHIESGRCPHCWMNCYAPHSILMNPVRSAWRALWGGSGAISPLQVR